MTFRNYPRALTALSVLAALVASSAQADLVNLVTGTSGEANGAIFFRADFQSAGTGVLDPFVRLQHDNGPSNNGHSPNGEEQGYNTSGRPVQYDEKTAPPFTRDLLFIEIPTVIIDNAPYKEFLLDINEPNGQNQRLLSLDQVNIYTSSVGGQIGLEETLGTLRFSLGSFLGENVVTLDGNLNSGSGQGDMRMYVPLSNFSGVGANEFVYFYSYFGNLDEDHRTGGGFEEWAVRIPTPGSAALLATAGFLVTLRRRF